jgi:glucokinase
MLLGIDIGGTKIAAVVGNLEGVILARRSDATNAEDTPEAVLTHLNGLATAAMKEAGVTKKSLTGIGISCGGPLDTQTGTIYSPPNLPKWEAVPVRAWFEERYPNVPIFLDNDANATAVAEWRFGAGRGFKNLVFLTMGTGIGGGIILDGNLYRGTNDLAGEVGHQTILLNGPECGCGKHGCLEALASGPAIARLAKDALHYGRGKTLLAEAGGKREDITARHVVEAAKKGDPLSIKVLAEAGTYMGIGLANLIQILNPERIILGTIAVHAGELILEPIRKAISDYAWDRSAAVCSVVAAELGDGAQDLAAISLALPPAAA